MKKLGLASLVFKHRVEHLEICAALGVFAVGALVYLFDRSAADIYFIPAWWHFADGTPGLFGLVGQCLPSFAHTFCFCLLISALLTPWRIAPLAICVSWVAVEAFLELAQVGPAADRIMTLLPVWLANWPILGNVPSYFLHGRFDPLDLTCIGFGGAAAYLTIILLNRIGGTKSC